MSFDLTPDLSSSLTISDDGINAVETPTSTLSTAFDTSAFGSGSSVLSSFEPPTDGDLLALGQGAALTHLLEDPSGTDASLVRMSGGYRVGVGTFSNEEDAPRMLTASSQRVSLSAVPPFTVMGQAGYAWQGVRA